MKKILLTLLFVLIIIGITYYLTVNSIQPNIETRIEVVTEIDTLIVKRQLPAEIRYETIKTTVYDTVYVHSDTTTVKDTIAFISLEIDEKDIKGTLDIEYKYHNQIFVVNLSLINERETYYITETKIVEKTPFLKPIVSSTYTFIEEVYSIGAGLLINNKISITPSINTNGNLSLNLTYIF